MFQQRERQSACLSVTRLRSANTAERIKILFGVETFGDARNIRLVSIPPYGFDAAFAKLLCPFVVIIVAVLCRFSYVAPLASAVVNVPASYSITQRQ